MLVPESLCLYVNLPFSDALRAGEDNCLWLLCDISIWLTNGLPAHTSVRTKLFWLVWYRLKFETPTVGGEITQYHFFTSASVSPRRLFSPEGELIWEQISLDTSGWAPVEIIGAKSCLPSPPPSSSSSTSLLPLCRADRWQPPILSSRQQAVCCSSYPPQRPAS